MAVVPENAVVDFYEENGNHLVYQEWEALANDTVTELDACAVLAKLAEVRQRGSRRAGPDRHEHLADVNEWVYLFTRGKVKMFYAAKDYGPSGPAAVVALRFCLSSGSVEEKDESQQIVRERLKRWRKKA